MKWHFVMPFLFFLSSGSEANVSVVKNKNKDISMRGKVEKRETTSSRQNGMWSSIEDYHKLTEPIFDNNTTSNVTVQMGSAAFLHCKVRNLGERTISWIRRRDWHILTAGLYTYTNDGRFQMLHAEGSEDWTLQIKYVQERDNGTYECQVSTGQGVMSHFVNLDIVTPEAFILGGPGDYHVDIGSPIHLVCIIEKSTQSLEYILWYHNTKMINYDTSRGGITVETEHVPRTKSKLTVRDATEMDSGNYTCVAPNTLSASILVFVSEGDKMVAFSRRKSSNGSAAELFVNVMLWFVLLPFVTINIR